MKRSCINWIHVFCVLGIIGLAGVMIASCKAELSRSNGPGESETEIRKIIDLYPAPAATREGKKWGYIDTKGKFTILPAFDSAESFQDNGLAIVTIGDLSGIINTQGKFIAEPRFNYIESFSEGLAVAIDKNGYKVLNEEGKIVCQSKDYIGTFHEGRALTEGKDETGSLSYGYIDSTGNAIIKPKYKSAGDFRDGKAVVKVKDNLFELIDKNGKTIKAFNYFYVGELSEGLIPFQTAVNSKTGYMDEKGKTVIKPQFDSVRPFEDGRAVVGRKVQDYMYKDGLIDRKGELIINMQYDDIHPLKEGLWAAAVAVDKEQPTKGYRYAVVNRDGKFLTGFDYTSVSEFTEGYASVSDGNTTYFIDRLGKKALNLPEVKGDGSLAVQGELIRANVDGRNFYMDHTGNIVWKQSSNIMLNSGTNPNIRYGISEEKYKFGRFYVVYYPVVSGMESKTAQEAVNKRLKEMSIPHKKEEIKEDFSYEGDFSVKFFRKDFVTLELSGYDYHFGAAHGMPLRTFAHVNLKTGKIYELKDLFKKNSSYVKKLSDIVRLQIDQKGEEMGVWPESYKGIDPNQPFIITGDALELYFTPYEIAPYAAGFPTFTIPYKDIMDIIDTQGDFWKAFN